MVFSRSLGMGLGVVMGRGAGAVWVALLAQQLNKEDFARYGLALSLVMLVTQVGTMRLQAAPQRLYFDERGMDGRRRLLATCLWTPLALIAVAGTVWGLIDPADPITNGERTLILILVALALGTTLFDFFTTLAATEGAGRTYSFMTVVVFPLAILVFLPGMLHGGQPGLAFVLLCQLAGLSVSIAAGWIGIPVARVAPAWDRASLRDAVRFAGPSAFGALGFWVAAMGGRWIAVAFLQPDGAALFTLFSFIQSTWFSFVMAWIEGVRREVGAHQAAGDHAKVLAIFSRASRVLIILSLLANVVVGVLFLGTGFPVFIGYHPDALLIGSCFLAQVADLLVLKWHQVFIGMKRTGLMALLCWISAVVTTAFGVAIVPWLGPSGIFLGYAIGSMIVLPLCWRLWARIRPAAIQ